MVRGIGSGTTPLNPIVGPIRQPSRPLPAQGPPRENQARSDGQQARSGRKQHQHTRSDQTPGGKQRGEPTCGPICVAIRGFIFHLSVPLKRKD